MNEYLFISRELLKGRSVLRAYLNYRLKDETLEGRTIDIGGGSGRNYLDCVKRLENTSFQNFDRKAGAEIDFEKDRLPANDATYDTVLFLNVMEHIFNYQHIANEVVRITKTDGKLIGYVPFLMWYHPDHRDFFRYTHESLEIIFKRAGGAEVQIEAIAKGPFTAALHMINHLLPKIVRPLIFLPIYALDYLFLHFQNQPDQRYALGYYFTVRK